VLLQGARCAHRVRGGEVLVPASGTDRGRRGIGIGIGIGIEPPPVD